MNTESSHPTNSGFVCATKRQWRLIVLLGFLINIILIYPKMTPRLADIDLFDEARYIHAGRELANGNFGNIGRSPLTAVFYASTYLPFHGSPDWFVYSCRLGRLVLFSLLWLGSWLLAQCLAEYSSPFIIMGFLLISPALPEIITNGCHALFAAISIFALWQVIEFYREKRIKHLCIAALLVGLAILARVGEGAFLFLALLGFSVLLAISSRRINRYLPRVLIPFGAVVGVYLLLNYLGTGRFQIAAPGYLYTAFEQGHGMAYQKETDTLGTYYAEGQLDARRLFGTREQNSDSVIAAVRNNPSAYFGRIPRLAKLACWDAIDVYGGSLAVIIFLFAICGVITLVEKNRRMLLTIFLGWSSYVILYILLVYQPTNLVFPFAIVFSLAAIGFTSIIAAFNNKWVRSIWTGALLAVMAFDASGPQASKFFLGTLILLLGIWIIWIGMRMARNHEAATNLSIALTFCLILIINGPRFSPRAPLLSEDKSPQQSAVVNMRKLLKPQTRVAAYGYRDLIAADMAWISLVRSTIPNITSQQDLYEWLRGNNVQAIYLDGNLKKAQPDTWALIEGSLGKNLETIFRSDDGSIRLIASKLSS